MSDAGSSSILRFDRSGKFLRSYGRIGAGPGEFYSVGAIEPVGDSAFLAADWGARTLTLIRLSDGEPLRRWSSLRGSVYSLTERDGELTLGQLNSATSSILARGSMRDTALNEVLRLPKDLTMATPRMTVFRNVSVASAGPRHVVALRALNDFLVGRPGEAWLRFTLPAVRRKAMPRDMDALIQRDRRNYSAIYGAVSFLRSVEGRPDGGVTFVHLDGAAKGERSWTERAWVTIVDPTFSKACVDALIAGAGDVGMHVAFRGDTVLVLDQTVTNTGKAVATVRSFVVDTASCDWVPLVQVDR